MRAAGHRELAVADGLPARGADCHGVELRAAGVLEGDRFLAWIAVAVAPLLEGEEDEVELIAGVG